MNLKRVALIFVGIVTSGVLLTSSTQAQKAATMLGFSPARAAAQRDIEQKLTAIPSADEARKHHRFLTSEPHPAGSERNNELARWLADLWKQQGWEDVKLHRYDVLQSSPRSVSLEMVAPVRYKATLREDPYDADPDTKHPQIDGAYLGFSASGEVTAPVVYAHSGNPEDYDLLRKNGIEVRGKIVLVRYSNPYSYRGFKALTAERNGAAAILIYSDPAEDGFKRGKVYPDGPWGPESHIQRGAITYDFIVPGDPLTPGWASVPGAKRIPAEEAKSLPKIIAVPLSWRDAKPLLENMDGPEAPKSWQGGLPLTYRLGGEKVRVHVNVDMDTSVKPNYVVEARIRGSEFPDEWVVLGNHRDAWVFGGVDPSSGTASQIELTRALGELLKQGIRPRRTIVMCSWDGEEYALTASTEWGEQFADELKQKAVAYLNVDSSASGPNFEGGAVGSLAPLLVEVSKTLQAPSGKSLYDEWRATRKKATRGWPTQKHPAAETALVDTRIGSGSDHTVFLNHLGIPSVLLSFEGPYGVYHSMYDNHYWMEHFGDPGFKYHALMSRLWGVLALRLANADILPYDFAAYGASIQAFLNELSKTNLKSDSGAINLTGPAGALKEFETAGKDFNTSLAGALKSGQFDGQSITRINELLMKVEGNWLYPQGIPGRPWFKHQLYGTRFTYAHLELPGLTEAVESQNWDIAREQVRILGEAVARNNALLKEATLELSRALASRSKP